MESASHGAEDSYESWIPFEGGTENPYNKKLCECDKLGCIKNEIFFLNLLLK